MTTQEIQSFADKHSLDVRPMNSHQHRLMGEYGDYILDVYFKKNKHGEVIKNSVLHWSTGKWHVIHDIKQLEKLLPNEKIN